MGLERFSAGTPYPEHRRQISTLPWSVTMRRSDFQPRGRAFSSAPVRLAYSLSLDTHTPFL